MPKTYIHDKHEKLAQLFKERQWQQVITLSESLQEDLLAFIKQSHWWAGQAHKELAQYDKASQEFEHLIEQFPDSHQGYEGLIQIAQHQQDWDKVVKLASYFICEFPKLWQGHWQLGQAYKNLAQYDKACEQFDYLIEKFADSHLGYEGLVQVAQHQKDNQKVLEYAKTLQQKFPQLRQSYWFLGQAHKELAQYDKACEQFDYLIDNFNAYQGYEGLIAVANDQADWQAMLALSQKAIDTFAHRLSFYYRYGVALGRLKRFDEAQQYFLALSKQFDYDPLPLLGLANVYYTQRKWDKSIFVLQKALLKFPTHQNIAHQLINSYLMYNEPEDALYIFHQYLSHQDSIANQLLLARILQVERGNEYYLNHLDFLYHQYPDDVQVALAYANALINLTLEEVSS